MSSLIKDCYVLLNRNFLTIKINNFPDVERNDSELFNSGGAISSSESFNENYQEPRRKVKDFDKNEDSHSETSHSEFSADDSSEESEDERRKRKIIKPLVNKEPKKLICLVCDKSCSTYASYLVHNRTHKYNQFNCFFCKKAINYRQSLINHMKYYHPEVQPFVCEYKKCEESFKTHTLLKRHSKTHFRYMCRFCKRLFEKKVAMRRHVKNVH